ncbi:MAG: glycosyltransferase [Chitinophagaceae bacterium]
MNILFVAFEFPPLGGAGVQRSMYFVKYLSQNGINPVVVTALETDYVNVMPGHPIDKSLLNEIPENTIIERIHCKNLNFSTDTTFKKLKNWLQMYFAVYENFKKAWQDEVRKKLPELIKKYDAKAIYVSLPPFAMGPMWAELKKENNLPLVVDFRDAWSQWCVAPNQSYFHYLKKLQVENNVLQTANAVVCSSKQIMKDLQNQHKTVEKVKFNVINNGFDAELNINDKLFIEQKDKIVIGYVGSFYYSPEARESILMPWYKKPLHRMPHYVPRKEDWLYRSPHFFFLALKKLIDSNIEYKNKIEVRFAGKTPDWLLTQIESFGLTDLCKHYGYMNHSQVIDFQNNCDALLITSSKVIGGRDYSIAGKTYEYFTIGKPIIAFVCEGEQKDILEESKMALICNPDNTVQSANNLQKLFNSEITFAPNKEAILQYQRKKLTTKLASIIKQVTKN